MIDITCCPGCGCSLPADAPGGLCPECLLRAGLSEESDEPFDPAAVTTPAPVATPSSGVVFVPPAPSELAALFPQLEIHELLGHGGMGAVYKARQNKLDRLVALKIIRPESAVDAAFAERFTREARTLARLTHAGIVGVHDFGEVITRREDAEHPLFYFVMEYVDGLNLRQLMDSEGLSPDQALAIVPQICEALQYAHNQGVIHRDIKPENILVDRQGRVKIADFGLARLVEATGQDFTLTATHQVMGTPRYMSPEQMAGSHAVDHRADIYSLGVVFYELLTGEVPMGQFEPPSRKAAVDVRLDEVVMRALAREPERRYQSASELKSRVDAISSAIEPTLLPGHAEQRRKGFSTIMEREAVAAWQWVAGDSTPSQAGQRRQLPALLMIALCLAGSLAALFPWIAVEFPSQAGGPDAPPVPPMAMATLAAGYGVLAFQEAGPPILEMPAGPASGRHNFAGVDLWPGMVFCVDLALLALLLIALPDRHRRQVRWLLLMVLLSGGALAQAFLFVYAVEQTRFRPVDPDSALSVQQTPFEDADTSEAPQFVYFQAAQPHEFRGDGIPQPLSSLQHRLIYHPAWMGAVGVSIALLLLSTTGVRHALTDHETGRNEPTRGRLPLTLPPVDRLAAPQPRPVATPASAADVPSDVVAPHRAVAPPSEVAEEPVDVHSEIDSPSLALIVVGVLFMIGHAITIALYLDAPYSKDMFWIGVPGMVIGIAMVIGGLNLRYLWSFGWAQIGTWASFLPLTPAWLISLFVGIAANNVLSRPQVRRAFNEAARRRRGGGASATGSRRNLAPSDAGRQPAESPLTRQIEEQLDHARALVDGPAISLLIVGILAAVGCAIALPVIGSMHPADIDEASLFLVPGALLGLLVAVGAWCMRSLRSYGLAMAAGVLCVVPLPSPALLVTMPLGIWALVVLKRPDVREAFVLAARLRREQVALNAHPRFSLKAIVAAVLISGTMLLAAFVGLLYLSGRFTLDPNQMPTLLLFMLALPLLVVPFVATILGFIAVSEIRHSRGRLIGLGLAFADAVFFPTLIAIAVPATLMCLDANPGARFGVLWGFGSFLTAVAAVVLWFMWRSLNRPIERSA